MTSKTTGTVHLLSYFCSNKLGYMMALARDSFLIITSSMNMSLSRIKQFKSHITGYDIDSKVYKLIAKQLIAFMID